MDWISVPFCTASSDKFTLGFEDEVCVQLLSYANTVYLLALLAWDIIVFEFFRNFVKIFCPTWNFLVANIEAFYLGFWFFWAIQDSHRSIILLRWGDMLRMGLGSLSLHWRFSSIIFLINIFVWWTIWGIISHRIWLIWRLTRFWFIHYLFFYLFVTLI